ncbi:MAG: hypothetical protein ACK5U8_26340, partial [Deltaproteobacteria bacterium]
MRSQSMSMCSAALLALFTSGASAGCSEGSTLDASIPDAPEDSVDAPGLDAHAEDAPGLDAHAEDAFLPTDAPPDAGCAPAGGPCRVDSEEGEWRGVDGSRRECEPTGRPVAAGIECRASRGECDRAERCDGEQTRCPGEVATLGELCRASRGPCDLEERCEGADTCPA